MNDRVLFAVIVAVATTLLACVVGIIVLALNNLAIPDVLQNVAVGSLAGLIGLLVPRGDHR